MSAFGQKLGLLRHAPRPQLVFTRWLLIIGGGLNIWFAVSGDWIVFQLAAGLMAAVEFLAAGIIWERYTPTFADELARSIYGADNATDLIVRFAARGERPSG